MLTLTTALFIACLALAAFGYKTATANRQPRARFAVLAVASLIAYALTLAF